MLEIYITDLAAYNKGYLIGEWVELPLDSAQLTTTVDKILRGGEAICFMESGYYEKHEEHFITDYAWESVELFDVDEYANLQQLNESLQLIQNIHPAGDIQEHTLKIIKFLLGDGIATDLVDALEKVDDVVVYEEQSMEDIAYNLIQECYNIHELSPLIANHIDYAAIGRDLEMEGRYTEVDGDIYEYIA